MHLPPLIEQLAGLDQNASRTLAYTQTTPLKQVKVAHTPLPSVELRS